MLTGTIYGVVLNDCDERQQLAATFREAPYHAPPEAPVLYIKPRSCVVPSASAVAVPEGRDVVVAATIALLFGRETALASAGSALGGVSCAALALDVSLPCQSYFRPPIAERCRDGFLPLGAWSPLPADLSQLSIETLVDGAVVHRWGMNRLKRDADALVAAVSLYMTFAAGDVLLLGLAGDAPSAAAGSVVEARVPGFAHVAARFVEEAS